MLNRPFVTSCYDRELVEVETSGALQLIVSFIHTSWPIQNAALNNWNNGWHFLKSTNQLWFYLYCFLPFPFFHCHLSFRWSLFLTSLSLLSSTKYFFYCFSLLKFTFFFFERWVVIIRRITLSFFFLLLFPTVKTFVLFLSFFFIYDEHLSAACIYYLPLSSA